VVAKQEYFSMQNYFESVCPPILHFFLSHYFFIGQFPGLQCMPDFIFHYLDCSKSKGRVEAVPKLCNFQTMPLLYKYTVTICRMYLALAFYESFSVCSHTIEVKATGA
jgi:hypothetical protein